MGWLTRAAAIAAMVLFGAGCGGESEDGLDQDNGTEHHEVTQTSDENGASLPTGNDGDADALQDAGGSTAKSSVELTRNTAEGTMAMFIDHMQSGRLEEALLIVDPESLGYANMAGAVSALNDSEGKIDSSGISLEPILKAMWSRPWRGATFEALTVRDDRARFEYNLKDQDPMSVDLTNVGSSM